MDDGVAVGSARQAVRGVGVGAACEPGVRLAQVLGVAGEADPSVLEEQDVVADVLQLGQDVRGDHDRDPPVGGLRHEQPGHLVADERIEVGERLVQEEQVGLFAEGQGQGDSGAFASGEGADPGLQRDPAVVHDALGLRLVPAAGLSLRPTVSTSATVNCG